MEQLAVILDFAKNPCHRLFYAFMAYAGLRYIEAKNLKPENIKDGKIYLIGKGKKIAFIPICEKLQEEINRYGKPFDFKNASYNKTFIKTVKDAGAFDDARCSFHRLRHSFGSNLIRAGANIKAVQLLMRHSNIQTTLNIYAHILDSDLIESVNLLK